MLLYYTLMDGPGDREKFDALYGRYKNLIYSIAFQILEDEGMAEDAVQETFLYVAKNMKKIGAPAAPETKTFLSIIGQHQAIDLYRKRKRTTTEPLDILGQAVRETEEPGGLAQCIRRLPGQERDWILLRFHYGYSVKEVCRMMHFSLSAGYRFEQRAKKHLRTLCEEGGVL